MYVPAVENDQTRLRLLASYAYKQRKTLSSDFGPGEGLVGQCALEKERILLTNVPENYIQITSGLGEAKPLNIIVLPVLFEEIHGFIDRVLDPLMDQSVLGLADGGQRRDAPTLQQVWRGPRTARRPGAGERRCRPGRCRLRLRCGRRRGRNYRAGA